MIEKVFVDLHNAIHNNAREVSEAKLKSEKDEIRRRFKKTEVNEDGR